MPPTAEMTDISVKIMIEVLSILGIATKEIKQSRMSEYVLYKSVTLDWRIFRKILEETDRKDRPRGCAEEARQVDK